MMLFCAMHKACGTAEAAYLLAFFFSCRILFFLAKEGMGGREDRARPLNVTCLASFFLCFSHCWFFFPFSINSLYDDGWDGEWDGG
jgi:hypothetical protein